MSKRRKIEPFEWFVYHADFNTNVVTKYNILKYNEVPIKKLKRKFKDKQQFTEELEHLMRWMYWSRCEWELIVERQNNKIYLKPWAIKEPDNYRKDVTTDQLLDWDEFAEKHISEQIYESEAKIDAWDQINFKWNEFVDYCWTYRHKYERVKKTEESTVACLPNDTIAKGMIKYLNEHLPPVEEPKNKFEELCFRFNVHFQSSDTDKSRVINLFTKILSEDCYTEFIDVINGNYTYVEVDEWADK